MKDFWTLLKLDFAAKLLIEILIGKKHPILRFFALIFLFWYWIFKIFAWFIRLCFGSWFQKKFPRENSLIELAYFAKDHGGKPLKITHFSDASELAIELTDHPHREKLIFRVYRSSGRVEIFDDTTSFGRQAIDYRLLLRNSNRSHILLHRTELTELYKFLVFSTPLV